MSAPDKSTQIKAMASVLVSVVPRAAPAALGWAGELYEYGVRVHPELAKRKPLPTDIQKQWASPKVQQEAEVRVWKLVREMAEEFPHLRPLVTRLEEATTPEEKMRLTIELRDQIQPEVLERMHKQFMEGFASGDDTE